jgi:hypothetical protein
MEHGDTRAMRRGAILIAVFTVGLLLAQSAQAAAPRYILVSGPTLTRPILLPKWRENHALLMSILEARNPTASNTRGLGQRPRFNLALFWLWSAATPPTRPTLGDQHGWFYPASRGKPPLIKLLVSGDDRLRLAPPLALRILAQNGVPIRL